MAGDDVRRPARRRDAAGRVRDPADRREDAHRERPARGHRCTSSTQLSYAGEFNATLLEPQARARTARSTRSRRSRSTASRCTTTVTMFTQAGLDPDKPPTTWDEVRASTPRPPSRPRPVSGRLRRRWPRATREAGSSRRRPTLAAAACRRPAPTAATAATLDNEGTRAALQFLHDLRWDRTTRSWPTARWTGAPSTRPSPPVSSAMYTSGSDVFTSLVQTNGVKGDDVRPDRHPAGRGRRRGRARRWHAGRRQHEGRRRTRGRRGQVDRLLLPVSKLLDETQAEADAKVRNANGQAVGTPVLPIFSRAQYEKPLELGRRLHQRAPRRT